MFLFSSTKKLTIWSIIFCKTCIGQVTFQDVKTGEIHRIEISNQRTIEEKENTFKQSQNEKKVASTFRKIKGSPFLYETFKVATIVINDSILFENIKARLDLVENEIHILSNDTIKYVNLGLISKIVFKKDSQINENLVFKSGFLNKKNPDFSSLLFQILEEGKITLLNKKSKTIEKDVNEVLNTIQYFYKDFNDIYVYLNKNLEKAKLTKTFFFDRFKESKLSIMQKFVTDNFIDFKKIDDLKMLVNFYNSLPE